MPYPDSVIDTATVTRNEVSMDGPAKKVTVMLPLADWARARKAVIDIEAGGDDASLQAMMLTALREYLDRREAQQ